MLFSVYTLIPFLAMVSYTVLFLIVILNKPRKPSRVSFGIYLLSMAIWSLAALLVRFSDESLIFWFRMMVSSAVASMLALFQFAQDVLYRKYKFSIYVYIYSIISILIAQFTALGITQAAIVNDILEYQFSVWISLIAGPGYLLMIFI